MKGKSSATILRACRKTWHTSECPWLNRPNQDVGGGQEKQKRKISRRRQKEKWKVKDKGLRRNSPTGLERRCCFQRLGCCSRRPGQEGHLSPLTWPSHQRSPRLLFCSSFHCEPSAPREALRDHLGVCMSGAYGTSGFPGAGCVQHLLSSRISILHVLVGAISGKAVELDIKAVFRNNLVITSAGGHQ